MLPYDDHYKEQEPNQCNLIIIIFFALVHRRQSLKYHPVHLDSILFNNVSFN